MCTCRPAHPAGLSNGRHYWLYTACVVLNSPIEWPPGRQLASSTYYTPHICRPPALWHSYLAGLLYFYNVAAYMAVIYMFVVLAFWMAAWPPERFNLWHLPLLSFWDISTHHFTLYTVSCMQYRGVYLLLISTLYRPVFTVINISLISRGGSRPSPHQVLWLVTLAHVGVIKKFT